MRNSYLMNSLFNCAVVGNTLKSFHTFTKKKTKEKTKRMCIVCLMVVTKMIRGYICYFMLTAE